MHTYTVFLLPLRNCAGPVSLHHPHLHSFVRDGNDRLPAKVTSGITDLLGELIVAFSHYAFLRNSVPKSTGSAFHEYTTLVEVDGILSTSVELYLRAFIAQLSQGCEETRIHCPRERASGRVWDVDGVVTRAKSATLDIFALDESASASALYAPIPVLCTFLIDRNCWRRCIRWSSTSSQKMRALCPSHTSYRTSFTFRSA